MKPSRRRTSAVVGYVNFPMDRIPSTNEGGCFVDDRRHDPRATCPECGKLFRPWPNGSIWCSVYCQTTPPPK